MSHDNEIRERGEVIEALPSLKFRVQLQKSGEIVFSYLSGRLHRNFIRIVVGDTVEVVVPEQGSICRIVKRL